MINFFKFWVSIWPISYRPFACRGRMRCAFDSPHHSASIDVQWVPRQTKGKTVKRIYIGGWSIFSSFGSLFGPKKNRPFVCRGRMRCAIDSPDHSASIDVQWAPRQTNGKTVKRIYLGGCSVFWSFGPVFGKKNIDHSFAGGEWDVQSIALIILHRLMYSECPGKRMERLWGGFTWLDDQFFQVLGQYLANIISTIRLPGENEMCNR